LGGRIGAVAAELQHPFMPWQQMVADVGGELVQDDETGLWIPAYREVIVTVMRQSGKTTLVLSVMCEQCLLAGPYQKVAYTAQTGLDGRQKFVRDMMPVLKASPVGRAVERFYQAADNTGAIFKNGSRLSVLATSQDSGHGFTFHKAVVDEAMADEDDRREQALLPTMSTKPEAQIWNVSTAGTARSTYLRRKVTIGRAAVRSGQTSGVAYFEWAIPDDADIDDPEVWRAHMPALGHTISEANVRHARQTMGEGEWRRAFGNQWTETDERVIPAEWWTAVCVHGAEADQTSAVFAVDARVDRSASAIAVSDGTTVELVGHGPGVSWLVDWFAARPGRTVVYDAGGPLANIASDLAAAGGRLIGSDVRGLKQACASFFDAVADQKVQVRTDSILDDAAARAQRRSLGDSWVWHREAFGGDMLIACSLAYVTQPRDVKPMIVVGRR
jgi:hypothetical protein